MNCHADVERERINQRNWTRAVQPAPPAIPRLQRAGQDGSEEIHRGNLVFKIS